MPARRPIRRAQLISTFGVGGMVDFPRDESLMIAGLDVWPAARRPAPPDLRIDEERLARRLGVAELRLPPDYREGHGRQASGQRVPAVRFPRWHYCPRCGAMEYLSLFAGSRVRCRGRQGFSCNGLPERRRPFVIPVRIAAVCEQGHIRDFPFIEWAHSGDTAADHQLRYVVRGSSAALSGISIRCMTCSQSRTLAGSFDYDPDRGSALSRIGYRCPGDRPWLGQSDDHTEGCGDHLRAVQRGASNVYFPVTVSSIYLPLWGEGEEPNIIRALEDPNVWAILTGGLIDGRQVDRTRVDTIARMRHLNPDALMRAAQRRLDGIEATVELTSEEEYRRAEYMAFAAGRGGENTDLLVEVLDAASFAHIIQPFIRRICLIRKLKETRALAGFTRVLPPEDFRDARIQPLSIARVGWLPATVVRGEGIFLEFEQDALDRWGSKETVIVRALALDEAYNRKRQERGQERRPITPKFLFLHTLAHLLIKQLSFDCGYGSASLRERIYCETEPGADPMQGILIFTASGDAEGTLGGLVRQGEPGRFEPTLLEATRNASWCSSDPVCIESPGQGVENANLAACHGCALVSETSCEEGNRLLDRAMVIGRMQDPRLGFLSRLLQVAGVLE
jgi:hypothetical protein